MTLPPVASLAVPARDRLPALDGLRGLAILAVLLHHLFVYDPVGAIGARVATLAEFAGHGVDLFFALSGFLIARQLADHHGTPGFARRFWLRRIAKIAPLYLAVNLVVFALLKPLLTATGHTEKLRWLLAHEGAWPWYVTFASNVRNALDARFTNPALDVAWSLAVEVQFYVLAFLIARRVAPARWPRLALAAIALALVFRGACVATGAGWVPILVLTPGRLDAFACGVLATMAPAWLARCPRWLGWGVLALAIVTPWSRATPFVELAGYTLVALAAGLVLERATRPAPAAPMGWLAHPALVLLGRISYSIYLSHLPLRALLRDKLLPAQRVLATPADWCAQIVFWLGAGGTCVAVGWLTWKFFEEPARLAVLRVLQPRPAAGPRPPT
ncbi:MAG: hypothetical protein RLZZ15_2533 [Verrucomicrobiota bacterium]